MRRTDFSYQLPPELIAKVPTPERSASRLLYLNGDTGALQHMHFTDVLSLVEEGDLMVFNDTRVIPARVFGHKLSGGKIEILVERILDSHRALAHVRSSKAPAPGTILKLENGAEVKVLKRHEALFELRFDAALLGVLEDIGHIPLPPYIDRADDETDWSRYQTVYGSKAGAVAAPTAGLHFDEGLLQALDKKGVRRVFVTLHVGAGTFQPVRADDIREHKMHAEIMELSQDVVDAVNATRAAGKRVIAVGTTSVRCLESAASLSDSGEIRAYQGETNIFIYPSYAFKVVDVMITNFHLPESTLLMLVSAFAGHRHTFAAYEEAVAEKYRFYSYGDAMFITRNSKVED